jgi:hypothetical protein
VNRKYNKAAAENKAGQTACGVGAVRLTEPKKETTMAATITQINRPDRDDYRKAATRFTVYTDGVGRDLADKEYFRKHDIGSLNFKCASWSRVVGFAAAIEARHAAAAIEEAFGVRVALKFSRTAGCSCGCSPGFVGTILDSDPFAFTHGGSPLSRASIWVDVPLSEAEKQSIVEFAAKQAKKLPAEIEAGNAKVAAEKAAEEEARKAKEARREERRQYRAAQEQKQAEMQADESFASACL